MSNISFFAGASNVKITGGEFNIVKGNMNVFDQSRHTHLRNAFNTENHVTLDSYNNNNTTFHDAPPPNRRIPGNPQGSNPNDRDPRQYFPPPTQNPMFAQFLPTSNVHPPGSRTILDESYNVTNNMMTNVMNDNDETYGAQHPDDKRRKKKDGAHKEPSSDSDNSEMDINIEEPVSSEKKQEYGSQLKKYRQSPLRGQPLFEAQMENARSMSTSPSIRNGGSSYQNYAQFEPGDIQPMSKDMQALLSQMMQLVEKETAPSEEEDVDRTAPKPNTPRQRRKGRTTRKSKSRNSSSGSEDPDRPTRMEDPKDTRMVTDRMAEKSLNDQLRPAFSRVKSDPQAPQPPPPQFLPPPGPPAAQPDLRRGTTGPELPAHLQHPYVNGYPGPGAAYTPVARPAPGPYPQQYYQGQAIPANQQFSNIPPPPGAYPQYGPPPPGLNPVQEEFGIRPEFVRHTSGPGPTYNEIKGDYTKIDRTIHTTAIQSGNTTNNLTMDSHNKNTITSYEAPVQIGESDSTTNEKEKQPKSSFRRKFFK